VYKVDPRPSSLARNLLSKNNWRLALLDEPLKRWPKVPLIIKPCAFACRAERLAWAASSPHLAIIWPSGVSERVAPHSDSCKEVALCISSKLIWSNILNTPFVHVTGRYVSGCD